MSLTESQTLRLSLRKGIPGPSVAENCATVEEHDVLSEALIVENDSAADAQHI